jgi:hypothetical protein
MTMGLAVVDSVSVTIGWPWNQSTLGNEGLVSSLQWSMRRCRGDFRPLPAPCALVGSLVAARTVRLARGGFHASVDWFAVQRAQEQWNPPNVPPPASANGQGAPYIAHASPTKARSLARPWSSATHLWAPVVKSVETRLHPSVSGSTFSCQVWSLGTAHPVSLNEM